MIAHGVEAPRMKGVVDFSLKSSFPYTKPLLAFAAEKIHLSGILDGTIRI